MEAHLQIQGLMRIGSVDLENSMKPYLENSGGSLPTTILGFGPRSFPSTTIVWGTPSLFYIRPLIEHPSYGKKYNIEGKPSFLVQTQL